VHVVYHGAVVGLRHEAVERAVAADGEQLDIGERASVEADRRERGRTLAERIGLSTRRVKIDERAAVGFIGLCRD
jgi:hypothetical protein